MYCCFQLIYMRCDWFNEWKTEKCHECANMGKVKWLELWWQLYPTSLPIQDLENFRPMDFCWTECTCILAYFIITHIAPCSLYYLLFLIYCHYCYLLKIMNSVSWGCTAVCEMDCLSVYRWINEYVITYIIV